MKVVVAHPEEQHSLRTADELFMRGCLEQYLTTVYYSEHSTTRKIARFLPGRYRTKATLRRSNVLPADRVTQFCEAQALIKLLFQNVKILNRFYSSVRYRNSDNFAVKAAHYAMDHGADIVIGYDNTSPVLFEILQREAPEIIRIQDMTALNTHYVKHIYEKDFILKPNYAEMLRSEQSRVWNAVQLDRKNRELASAQYYLCASTVTRDSLTFSGVKEEQCLMVPYGVDRDLFACKRFHNPRLPLKFVFVGGTKELKGISYLLDAFEGMDPKIAQLSIVGANSLPQAVKERYSRKVSFTGPIMHNQLPAYLQSQDAMIFPSLGDGFGLAALEGMSCGLPLVCSDKSGIKDLVKNGVNGYVIPTQDERAIVERVFSLAESLWRIPEMGREARRTAESYSWNRYGDSLYRLLGSVIESRMKYD